MKAHIPRTPECRSFIKCEFCKLFNGDFTVFLCLESFVFAFCLKPSCENEKIHYYTICMLTKLSFRCRSLFGSFLNML